jgi:hypothetical protein
MPKFRVTWSVFEVVHADVGVHDDGVKDGDRRRLAGSEIIKEARTKQEIESDLISRLKKVFPRHAPGSTYDLEREYKIEISEV